jgi:hypothetical protein
MGVKPWMAIMQLSHVFGCICVKVWTLNEIGSLKEDVAITISLLKKKFLLAFFDIMTHLLLHVVHSCWMYPVEQMMKVLKGYVRNTSQPKGLMAEGCAG